MAVTSQGKGRATKTRAGAMKQKRTVKSRNAPAKALAGPRYRPRVVKGAKVYSRKDQKTTGEDDGA